MSVNHTLAAITRELIASWTVVVCTDDKPWSSDYVGSVTVSVTSPSGIKMSNHSWLSQKSREDVREEVQKLIGDLAELFGEVVYVVVGD